MLWAQVKCTEGLEFWQLAGETKKAKSGITKMSAMMKRARIRPARPMDTGSPRLRRATVTLPPD
jgi:hypothetical protein